ncbi:MAG: hypothetical protein EOO32_00660 [Comamonadaceae bacterium]|nr:MAG: hypothetical protein EOO32_00660 [Comamonadaceae bacterium]
MVDTYRQLGSPVDERTELLGLPLPHLLNDQRDDVPRMRDALAAIDAAVQLLGLDMDSRDADLSARAALLEWAGARPQSVVYGYDAQGRMQSITQTVGGTPRTATLTYDAQGRVATHTYPVSGGALCKETYHYDDAGRLTGSTAVETQP